jgi:LacI family transcriptional regulator
MRSGPPARIEQRRDAALKKSQKPSTHRRPTLKDIARDLGLHVSTISRALNPDTKHGVSPELADKIRRVSARRGYRPNAAAYNLKTNRSRIVGVVIPDITDPVFPPIIRGIEDGLARHGYVAVIANTDGNAQKEAQVIDSMRGRGVDGLILASVLRHDRGAVNAAAGLPVVTVSRRTDDTDYSSVVHDEDDGMRQVLTHLASLGHRNIVTIAGPQTISTGYNRYSSYVHHCETLKLGAAQPLASFARAFNETEGERCAEELLATGRRFTAIVCANDRLAVGVVTALRRHGIDCPRDVSVTGFNDMPLCDRLFPPLTTVRVQHHRAGLEAAETMVGLIARSIATPRHIVLPVALVARESTQPPAAMRGERRAQVSGNRVSRK